MKIVYSFILIFSSGIFAKDIVMKHMPEGNNCIICHEKNNPNVFFLRNGVIVPRTELDVLCGQCHGIKHRRWKDGRHGKVTNSWMENKKERWTCIKCHDPHSPRFPKFESFGPPKLRGMEESLKESL